MFCLNCGKELPEGTAFCSSCGQKVGEAQPVTTLPTSAQPNEVLYVNKRIFAHMGFSNKSEGTLTISRKAVSYTPNLYYRMLFHRRRAFNMNEITYAECGSSLIGTNNTLLLYVKDKQYKFRFVKESEKTPEMVDLINSLI